MGKILDWLIRPLAKAWEINNSYPLQFLGKGLKVRKVDVIIGTGTALKEDGAASLMSEAVAKGCTALYRLKVGERILFTGGYTCNGMAEARAMKKIALAEKVPLEAIILEEESFRTWMNAAESLKIMEKYGWRSAVVVCQHIHSRKVRATFQKVFTDSGIDLYFIKVRSGYEKIPQRRFTSEARFLLTWEIPTYLYSKLKGLA